MLARERAAVALLGQCFEAAQRLRGRQAAFGQIVHRRVQQAGIGQKELVFAVEFQPAQGLALDGQFNHVGFAHQLPERARKEGGPLALGIEGRKRALQRFSHRETLFVLGDGPLRNRPMHLRETTQLRLNLPAPMRLVADLAAGAFEQLERGVGGPLQRGCAHRLGYGFGQFACVAGRHDGHELVRQGGGEQRVLVGGLAEPAGLDLLEASAPAGRSFKQPAVNTGDTAQVGKQHRVWPQPLADHAQAFPHQRRQQVRAGPQIRRRARLRNEALHRPKAHRQQRGRIASGHRAAQGRHHVQVLPDRVVGHARVGRQQTPQCAELGCHQRGFGAEAPESELCEVVVGRARAVALDQLHEVIHAGRADVRGMYLIELAEVEFLARQRMDQDRPLDEANVGPARARAAVFTGPLRPVGGRGVVVGARVEVSLANAQRVPQRSHRAVFMADALALVVHVAHQHQGFLGRVVQPGGEFAFPEFRHGSGQPGKLMFGIVEHTVNSAPQFAFVWHVPSRTFCKRLGQTTGQMNQHALQPVA